MCGIVGYVGHRNATEVLLTGLGKLEYRGYDSAGVAVNTGSSLTVRKWAGKLNVLRDDLRGRGLNGTLGVGHTRWATHGRPNDANAHPHATEDGRLVIIHNGIIENYLSLKAALASRGHKFSSETDSEVLAHLIEEKYTGISPSAGPDRLEAAVRLALEEVEGAYSLVVAHQDHREIVAARTVSPLVLGLGQGENFLASDVPALLPYTRDVVFLHDGDMAVLTDDAVRLTDLAGNPVERPATRIEWSAEDAEKGGFEHFMLKEIYEQPHTLNQTLGGRLHDETGEAMLDLDLDPAKLSQVTFLAMGTANIAGMYGAFMVEALARVPARAELAAEYRYRDPVADEHTLAVIVSQSGESIDTLEGLREARRKGARSLGIINAKGSTITREAQDTLYIHCGPEIGVASTKAYTSMLAAEALLAVWLGRRLGTIYPEDATRVLGELRRLPRLVEEMLERREQVRTVAEEFKDARDYLFLGRGVNVATAYEGALKLKEISYIHAEAYPTSEMKHGPIALIDENMPVVVIATESKLYDKTVSNIQEVKARGGIVIALATDGDERVASLADRVIYVPRVDELVSPILNVIPLQLLAYETARLLGCDVDQPRNLAKSVTVE
ncbi:MAG TPA: glutamine--fructose-6-phosphate transaminase (isomerizing) [Deinococcales bacterium]|nr:glutamine--fructose-6-phosphate transaminase (isomerizing) [Deinococcales bacterium]